MHNDSIDIILHHAVEEADGVPSGAVDFTDGLFCDLPKQWVHRMPVVSSSRFYFSFQGGELVHGTGLSAFAKHMSNSSFLDKWKQEKGMDADDIMDHASSYGTFVHVVYSMFATEYGNGRPFSVNQRLYLALKEYMKERGMPLQKYRSYCDRLARDVASFARFLQDYKVEVLACEYPVFDWDLRVSTPIDLVGTAEINGKRMTFAMNYKTRENASVYESDTYQIAVEGLLLDRNLPDLNVLRSFVFIPRSAKRSSTEPFIIKDVLMAKNDRLGRPYTFDDFSQDWQWQKQRGPNSWAYHVNLDAPMSESGVFTFHPTEGFSGASKSLTIRDYCMTFQPPF
jgi:hypothetical protein